MEHMMMMVGDDDGGRWCCLKTMIMMTKDNGGWQIGCSCLEGEGDEELGEMNDEIVLCELMGFYFLFNLE